MHGFEYFNIRETVHSECSEMCQIFIENFINEALHIYIVTTTIVVNATQKLFRLWK